MFIRCHVVDNAQAWNRQVVGAPGPVHVQGCRKHVRVDDGYSEEIGVRSRVGVSQDSVLSTLLFIIVLEALSKEFRTGCPWELLYADDLMISAGFMSMEELLIKLKTWKSEIKNMGLQVNMGNTKVMVSGLDLDLLKKFGKYPCSVCQRGVGSNAISCGDCLCWIHKKSNGIKGPLRPNHDFRCARCLGTERSIDGRTVKGVEVDEEKLEAVSEFAIYLLAVVVSWLL